MRKTHLNMSWGFLAALFVCLSLASFPKAAYTAPNMEPDGLVIKVKNMAFNEVVRELALQSGMHLVMKTENTTPITLNFPDPTSLEKILADATAAVGLEFWKSGETYIIGKHAAVDVDPDPPLRAAPPAPVNSTLPATLPTSRNDAPVTDAPEATKFKTIELQNANVREMCWMLGVPGWSAPETQRRRTLRTRIQTVLSPRNRTITETTGAYSGYGSGESYASPASSLPFLPSGSRNRGTESVTDSHQGPIFPPQPQPQPQPQPNPNPNPANPNDPNNPNAGVGGLAAFLPKGIDPANIIGLLGLNALLVKATGKTQEEAEEAINQLEQLIKMLDQPIKQVIVEVMFVKMEVKDAMSIGSSWEFAGMPLSINSNNGGSEGNFGMRYLKGNLKVQLATLITTTKAKVVNAPRVVVQNNGAASIQLEDSIPFIIQNTEEDVFGRQITTPDVDVQTFAQGLTVNNVTIHPDKSVTLDVTPVLEAPGAGIGIPGGAGQVLASSSADIQTIVRVKNGETIMMGGFVSRNESSGGTRDPLLSSLPIVGPLFFRNNSRSTNSTETLVFITPTIMEEDTTNFEGMATLPPLF